MKKILLANIGNRNIIHEGNYIASIGKTGTFREQSESLWQKTEFDQQDFASFHFPIIDNVLTHHQDYYKIIIVATDSGHEQDTCFAAKIIKKGLIAKGSFEADNIEIYNIKKPVTDLRHLLDMYKSIFLINQVDKDTFISICDAGGTPQQKWAMKIMAEFMLSSQQYEVLYVNQNGEVSTSNQKEYRDIITAQLTLQLCRNGNYRGAMEIRGKDYYLDLKEQPRNKADKLMIIGHFLLHLMFPEQLAKNKSFLNLQDFPFLASIWEKKPWINDQIFSNQKSEDAIKLGLSLSVCKHHLKKGNYNQAILTFSIFYELFLTLALSEISKIKIESGTAYKDGMFLFVEWLKQHDMEAAETFVDSVSFKANWAPKHSKNTIITEVCQLLAIHLTAIPKKDSSMEINSNVIKKLNWIRNKIAHEGYLVDDRKFNSDLGYFPELVENCCQLIQHNDGQFFESLNNSIEIELKKNMN